MTLHNEFHSRVIIVGSGPAGYTAAIYTARANLVPVLFQGAEPGGQLTTTTEIENFPGFPSGIQGPELMEQMREQAQRFGAKIVADSVQRLDVKSRPFIVETEGGTQWTCDTLIVATGASAQWLGIESEQRLRGHGVSACATCDGFFFKNQHVVVVGGGDSALEEATFLTRFASKVTIVHRRDAMRASHIMQERAHKDPKITFMFNSVVDEILGDSPQGVTGIRLRNINDNSTTELPCQGVFMAIGHRPNIAILAGQLELDGKGYIATRNGAETSVPGVFAAGDVADPSYRQAITAAGAGCRAAIDAERFLVT